MIEGEQGQRLVELNLRYTEPLYHIDLYDMTIRQIKTKMAKIKSSLKNLQHNLEDDRYEELIIDRVEDEIDIRQANIDFIQEYLTELAEDSEDN